MNFIENMNPEPFPKIAINHPIKVGNHHYEIRVSPEGFITIINLETNIYYEILKLPYPIITFSYFLKNETEVNILIKTMEGYEYILYSVNNNKLLENKLLPKEITYVGILNDLNNADQYTYNKITVFTLNHKVYYCYFSQFIHNYNGYHLSKYDENPNILGIYYSHDRRICIVTKAKGVN